MHTPACSHPTNILAHNGNPNKSADVSTDHVGADINANSSANSVDLDDVLPDFLTLQHTDIYIVHDNNSYYNVDDHPDDHPEHHIHHISHYNRHRT